MLIELSSSAPGLFLARAATRRSHQLVAPDPFSTQLALERAVQVILRAQSPLGGWRYHARPDCGQDTSVTAMVFVSLASARQVGIRYLENSPKVFNRKEIGHYYYAHYYAMQAMVQAGDEHYQNWYPQIRDSLLTLQKPDGSWNEGTAEKPEGYPHKTPMAIIILGTPYRYIPVYQE